MKSETIRLLSKPQPPATADVAIRFELDPDGSGSASFVAKDQVRLSISSLEIRGFDEDNAVLVDHLNIGHWGADVVGGTGVDGYDANNALKNNANDSFVENDPDRFIVQLTHHPGNANPQGAEELLEIMLRTQYNGVVTDDASAIQLKETGPNTGIFVSEPQLLTSIQLSGVDALHQDDGLRAYSTLATATVVDEAMNDRTHMATLDDVVAVEFTSTGGVWSLAEPVCDRKLVDPNNPARGDGRQTVSIRVHVFNEPFEDLNNNGVWDSGEPYVELGNDNACNTVLGTQAEATNIVNAEIARANVAWAQACIRIEQVGAILFENAPVYPEGHAEAGDNVFEDLLFNMGAAHDEEYIIINTDGSSYNIIDVYFVPPAHDDDELSGLANTPDLRGGINLPTGLQENTYLFVTSSVDIKRRVLAHEIGHALTNRGDITTVRHIFFPSLDGSSMDNRTNLQRRIQCDTEDNARTCRAAGDFTGAGNRLIPSCQ